MLIKKEIFDLALYFILFVVVHFQVDSQTNFSRKECANPR